MEAEPTIHQAHGKSADVRHGWAWGSTAFIVHRQEACTRGRKGIRRVTSAGFDALSSCLSACSLWFHGSHPFAQPIHPLSDSALCSPFSLSRTLSLRLSWSSAVLESTSAGPLLLLPLLSAWDCLRLRSVASATSRTVSLPSCSAFPGTLSRFWDMLLLDRLLSSANAPSMSSSSNEFTAKDLLDNRLAPPADKEFKRFGFLIVIVVWQDEMK